ncbi:MAG: hypothetical protein ABI847_06665 [Anaerolineales bacterium]
MTLGRAMLLGVSAAVLLVGLGLSLYPTTLSASGDGLRGVLAIGIILVLYGLAGAWLPRRLGRPDPWLLRTAITVGLLAGAVYAAEIVLEYVLLPADNSPYALIEFGAIFIIYFATGLAAARRTGQARDGLLAAVTAALISTLIWYLVLLAVTFAMRGTPQQAAVMRAEGNLEDFARSGMTDFSAWLMQDLLGAGFFHLLLGPLAAAILGGAGALAGKGLRRFRA